MENNDNNAQEQSNLPAEISPEQLLPLSTANFDDVLQQLNIIVKFMKEVMVEDVDYGLIPGCGPKPTLKLPGAEKLCTLFGVAPKYRGEQTPRDMGHGDHREYIITCDLYHKRSGKFIGSGVGSCSTKEAKYRWRDGKRKCPRCNKETIIKGKEEYGGGWLCFAKKGGCGAKFDDSDPAIIQQSTGRIENEDLADQYNTVLKMSKKRALVDAIKTNTAASFLFTQDIEDFMRADDAVDVTPSKPAKQIAHSGRPPTQKTKPGPAKVVTADELSERIKKADETEESFNL